jgi:hypothetical protein
MAPFSMYRGNLHVGGRDSIAAAPRRWEPPRPTLTLKRFRRLLRNRSRAIARLAAEQQQQRPGSPSSSAGVDGVRGAAEHDGEARGEEEADRVEELVGQQQQQQDGEGAQQQQAEEGAAEQQQQQARAEEVEQEEGAVEDADMNDAGEIVVAGEGNGDAEEGQGESEGVDPNQEEVRVVRILDSHNPCAAILLIVLTASNNFNLGNPLHTYVPSLQRM